MLFKYVLFNQVVTYMYWKVIGLLMIEDTVMLTVILTCMNVNKNAAAKKTASEASKGND